MILMILMPMLQNTRIVLIDRELSVLTLILKAQKYQINVFDNQ